MLRGGFYYVSCPSSIRLGYRVGEIFFGVGTIALAWGQNKYDDSAFVFDSTEMTINSITLVGRVGGDPDVRYFDSGSVKCRISLAVDRATKDDRPDWFNLELWGKDAEVAANYVRKGKLIGVTGYIKIDTWQDRATGAQRSSPVISVNSFRMLGSKRDEDPGAVSAYNDDEF